MECVAERYGLISSPFEAYSVDNDGRKELICSNESTKRSLHVFRENGDVIDEGAVDSRGYYVEEFGLNNIMVNPYEDWYDPEQGMFVVTCPGLEAGERRRPASGGWRSFKFSEFFHKDRWRGKAGTDGKRGE